MKWRQIFMLGFLSLALQVNGAEQPNKQEPQEQTLLNQTLNFARGHQEFKDLYFKQHEQEFIRLVQEGQSPQTLFIGCSDSRIVPDLILGTRPGDLFVIRTAGNFVPPYEDNAWDGVSATIQYAIEALNVKHIIICGHSHCGAIQGLFKQLDPTKLGIIQRWLKFGEEAKKMTLMSAKPNTPKEELYEIAEQISVIYQLEHLMSFPFVKKRVDEGKLDLHGWYYKIETGEVFYYDPETYRFQSLSKLVQNKSKPTYSVPAAQ
ncbi:carbonic anhydrase [Candidatus Protochlamydia phocaeensis]|uniref:carbonic anhydrase n=1 Tax=Candidatus Protochlamydia phocaeensis TaxID=1414722 RepID=UPI000A95B178|nr:carbonic anhydrase [Candidatus Protochlamydia phocaeensis]